MADQHGIRSEEDMDTETPDPGTDAQAGFVPRDAMSDPLNVNPPDCGANVQIPTKGNLNIFHVHSSGENTPADISGSPTQSPPTRVSIHTSCKDKSTQGKPSLDLEPMVQAVEETLSVLKQEIIAGQEQTGNKGPGPDTTETLDPLDKEHSMKEDGQTPLDNAAKVLDTEDKDNQNSEAHSPTTVDDGVATNVENTEGHASPIPGAESQHNQEPNADAHDFISGMHHFVSGEQGVVTPGQPPSDTEEPLQLQLRVAHSEIERLKSDVEHLTTELDDLKALELQRMAAKKNSNDAVWKKTCDALRTELEQMEVECKRKCASLEKDKKDMKNSIDKQEQYFTSLESRNVQIMQELAAAKCELDTLRPACQNYYQQASNLQQSNNNLKQVCANLSYEKTQLSKYNEQLVEAKQKQEEDINYITKENANLVLRLSKVAGDMLTAFNPNIADLSDVHRPTKLAEDFSECYDNEWTDAFEEAPMEPDEEKVKFLFNLLKRSYQLCIVESDDLYKRVLSQHAHSVISGADRLEFPIMESSTESSHRSIKTEPKVSEVDTKEIKQTARDSVKQTAVDAVKQTARDSVKQTAVDAVKQAATDTLEQSEGDKNVDIDPTNQEVETGIEVDPDVSVSSPTAGSDDADILMHEGTDVDKQDESCSSLETDVDTGIAVLDNVQDSVTIEQVKIDISAETRKVLTDLYKHIIMASAGSVNKKLQRVIENEFQLNYTKQTSIQMFVSKCLEISWLMVMQTPSVHIDFDTAADEKFEREKFKAFTVMGKTIDYIVWPCVYLHEGGPLLTKGIAQGHK